MQIEDDITGEDHPDDAADRWVRWRDDPCTREYLAVLKKHAQSVTRDLLLKAGTGHSGEREMCAIGGRAMGLEIAIKSLGVNSDKPAAAVGATPVGQPKSTAARRRAGR